MVEPALYQPSECRMDNTYYIYDPESSKLVVTTTRIGTVSDEEQLEEVATAMGLKWTGCSWGGVEQLDIMIS